MRASRLLSILLTLSVRGRVSAAQLAEELEVSVRTVHRDIEALSAAGVPLYTTRGRAGGVQLLDGYRTRLTGMTADEAEALFLSGIPGAAADLGLGSVLAATQLKLLAALPPELRERAATIRDRFFLDAPGWLREADAPPFLAAVAEAVWTQRRIDVRYERSNRAVDERVLDPLGLVLKAGTWYLVAAGDTGRRTYRVSRVLAAAVRDDTFTRPGGFVLEEFWAEYQRGYAQRVYREAARVRLSGTGRQLLFLIGTVPARRARATMSAPDADDWVEATVPIESVRHAQHALLQLVEHVEVLEPAELREAIARTAARVGALYAAPGGG
ncbi:MAG TPA: YafY family protein [Jatrophihabitans sp.]|uniref:helix-turn-helix transcriptional regulator n=1 Tax=Jatrophihabitans sp. TaxID=1932789 RepID=UPI002E047DC2|nr:YafY family protein [Jatrophihabitans sp.]